LNYRAFNASFTAGLNISGTTNTFSGKWHVVRGTLLGSGINSLGTNDITIEGNGALETLYNLNSTNGNLVLDGQMFLHQNHTFRTVTVGGNSLAAGIYTFAELNSAYPTNFPLTWPLQSGSSSNAGSGRITVLVGPPTVTLGFELIGSDLRLGWSQGTLQQADDVVGPWTNVDGAISPLQVTPNAARKFFRVLAQ
jgi:hypothetical protein